ncbi:D-3-phosphoglycerate dehydrogenase [Alloactinosynnema sp. L-07]|uniref:2-hydroxyacid dehydrogenase n=1 Tax=Alloactinosynnema sp. L-07 TaxID=1653480 RepID=UPI00065F0164|nr:2-hydroxyacid dehydrogenase [Alloactinosynnema sp. L-07]CRK58891.1 D-3-phosphoglycerate dehydrogenase [Alloactinosynnema sp. L-07]
MTVTVLVPDEHGVAALAGVEGIRVLAHSPELPPDGVDAQVLVPDFLGGSAIALLDRLPDLRLVQLLTTGADSWVGKLPPHIMLSTGRGAHGGSTAEWVVGALLAVYRELIDFDIARRAGQWTPHITDTLQDKRILVIGAGDLGQQLHRRLDAFDAHTTLVGSQARAGVRGIDEVADLLPGHDAVVLMVPLTPATTGLVDAAFLARMRDGAILVNAARGPVVDADALLAELTSGRLRAALDVTDPEPLPPGHPLWTAPNVLITPHVAGSCHGHRERAYRVAAAEITRFVNGENPRNLVKGLY